MAQVREVDAIDSRVADIALRMERHAEARIALHLGAGNKLGDEALAETHSLMSAFLNDLPEQRCQTLTDVLALTVFLRSMFADFSEANEFLFDLHGNEVFRRSASVFHAMGLILERATQGLEDAIGRQADVYGWGDTRQHLSTRSDA